MAIFSSYVKLPDGKKMLLNNEITVLWMEKNTLCHDDPFLVKTMLLFILIVILQYHRNAMEIQSKYHRNTIELAYEGLKIYR